MSFIVPGKMPGSCGYCPLRHEARDGDECYLGASLTEYQKRPDDCPLGPVSTPHGRLIDTNELWVEINKICDRRDAGIISDLTCLQQLLSAVRHAPTVIEAEEGKT